MASTKQSSRTRTQKTIRFEQKTAVAITETARNLKLNFNQTTQLLVDLGLKYTHESSEQLAFEMQRVIVAQGVNRALNRYLRLLSQAAIAANEAKEMAQQVFFRQLCQLADELDDPAEIDAALTLFGDEDALHAALIDTYKERQKRGHARAVQRLLRSVQIDDATWQMVLRWDEGRPVVDDDGDGINASQQMQEAIRQIVEDTVSQHLNRYLKLLVRTVLAATEAKEMAQQMFFAHLCGLRGQIIDPAAVDDALTLYPQYALDNALIELYRQRQKRGRNRAVRSLKKVIDIDNPTWQLILQQVAQT
ncbi:MAG TPA: hypothetical protein ENJ56_01620 [Anaerolineae bacterium]|nr:hypothetical protein [Anaerolineae bacterium]